VFSAQSKKQNVDVWPTATLHWHLFRDRHRSIVVARRLALARGKISNQHKTPRVDKVAMNFAKTTTKLNKQNYSFFKN